MCENLNCLRWFIAAVVILCGCSPGFDCVDTVKSEVPSPDQQWVVTVFERDCGATTAKNLQAQLHRASEPFNYKKNGSFFVIEADAVSARWLTTNEIEIAMPADAKVFRKDVREGSMTVHYVQRPSAGK